MLLLTDPQRFLQLSSSLQHIRDLPHRQRLLAHIPQTLIHRQLLLLTDPQRFLQLSSSLQHIRDLPHRQRLLAHIPQTLTHRQLLLLTNPQRFLQLSSPLQHIRDLPHRDGPSAGITPTAVEGELHLAPVGQSLILISQAGQQPAQLIERRELQLLRGVRVPLQPGSDRHHPPAPFRHGSVVRFPRIPKGPRRQAGLPNGRRRGWPGRRQEGIHAAPPGPEVGRVAGRKRDGLPIQPKHQPCPGLGGQALAAQVQGFPARPIQPTHSPDHMHHRIPAGIVHQPLLQHRHIQDLVAQRQAIGRQARAMEHRVNGGHHLAPHALIRRVHQQPLKRGPMDQAARQAQKVVVAWPWQVAGLGQPGLLDRKGGTGHAEKDAVQADGVAIW